MFLASHQNNYIMKYLPYEEIESINNQLSCIDNGDTRMFGRIECYSCKHTKDDIKLKHHLETKYEVSNNLIIPVSTSPQSPSSSSLISKKTFLYLLGKSVVKHSSYPQCCVSGLRF